MVRCKPRCNAAVRVRRRTWSIAHEGHCPNDNASHFCIVSLIIAHCPNDNASHFCIVSLIIAPVHPQPLQSDQANDSSHVPKSEKTHLGSWVHLMIAWFRGKWETLTDKTERMHIPCRNNRRVQNSKRAAEVMQQLPPEQKIEGRCISSHSQHWRCKHRVRLHAKVTLHSTLAQAQSKQTTIAQHASPTESRTSKANLLTQTVS
jgi:hypothetical protein